VRTQLTRDYRLAVIELFLVAGALSVAPFAVYRFIQGQWAMALLDTTVVLGMLVSLAYVWRTGRARVAGMLGAGFANAMAVVVVLGFGTASDWAYPSLIASFLVAPRWFAAVCAAIVITLIASWPGTAEPAVERMTFAAVGVVVSLFGLIFASGVDRTHERLRRAANLDPLTGVGNRRALDDELAVLRARQRGSVPSTLILLDIDHFKRINDVFGHAAGDGVLIELVDILTRNLRKFDRVFRLGGEEFVVLLSGLDRADVDAAVGKLMAELRGGLRGPGGPVSVSMGVTIVEPGEDSGAALARADRAMYQAKHRRDAWVMA
jgi:diguanylate cyclase (GGDEF)-like protein